jgi:hypothetical protein
MCPLEAHFQSREQPKAVWSEIWRVWWLCDDSNAFLGEELLLNKRCVACCIIVMQKPLSLQLAVLLPPNCIVQPLQNLHVEMTSNILSKAVRTHDAPNRRNKKKIQELFECLLHLLVCEREYQFVEMQI